MSVQKKDEEKGKTTHKIVFSLSVLLLSVMVLVTFWKSFENDFVDWDDYTYVVENDLVRNPQETTLKDVFSKQISSNYHPLTILSLRLNNNECKTCREGISPRPFIEWNVIIHLLNTLLVFLLIYLLSNNSILVAFLVAAIFGVHPMHVESVTWISERKDVLYSFFFLGGLLTWLKSQSITGNTTRKYIWFGATFLLFIFSCLSKAMAVVFPLVLMLLKFWIYKPEGENKVKESLKEVFLLKNIIPLIPFFLVSVFFGLLAISINTINTFTFLHRIQYASYGFVMYIVKFFAPVNQVAIYPYPTQMEFDSGMYGTLIKVAPIVVLIIIGLVIFSLKKTKLFAFGLGFFLLTVMMVLQIISVGVAIMADRYIYLGYIGLAFIPAMLIGEHINKKRTPFYILAGCFIIIMMILARKQTKVWKNGETLWSETIELYPDQETPRSLRGIYYSKRAKKINDIKEKRKFEEKAIADFKIAVKTGTKKPDIYEGMGCIYGSWGELNAALLCFNKAIQLKPGNGSAYFNRGITFGLLKRNAEAINDYNLALMYAPLKAFEIRTNRSNLYLSLGRIKDAVADMDYLISKDNRNVVLYFNRGVARQHLNNIPGAIADFRKALEINPDDTLSREALKSLIGK